MTDSLSRYPKKGGPEGVEGGQKQTPVPVKNLGLAKDDWTRNSVIEAGSEATAEKVRKREAGVQSARSAYFNRAKNRHVGPQMQDEDYE
jgi:hypothetical protein